MTVESTARKEQFTLDGVTAAFPFSFQGIVGHESDIKCKTLTGGTETLLTYTTQYTVAFNSGGVGGEVTLVDPAAVGLGTLTVYRETTNTQVSDYEDYNQFPADTLEQDLDIRTMISQEAAETNDRTLRLPITTASGVSAELPAPSTGKVLGWNDAATAIENKTFTPSTSLEIATQADAEAATNNVKYMTPLRVKNYVDTIAITLSPATNTADKVPQWNGTNSKTLKDGLTVGVAASNLVQLDGSAKLPAVDGSQLINVLNEQKIKGWVSFNGTGTIAIGDSYNVSGIVDNGAGNYTITWDTDFATANYALAGMVKQTANGGEANFAGVVIKSVTGAKVAGSVNILTNTSGGAGDYADVNVIALGDQ
jgi:hypothetical protein